MSIMNYMPVVMAVAFGAMGALALAIIGVAVSAVIWGFKKGSVRVTTGQRNFDDFGR